MNDVTQILNRIEDGDPSAADQLLPLVYGELRKLAAARMSKERSDHSLQATALVHDAYIRLVDVDLAQHWNSRGHFFAAAAEAMRRILIEAARKKNSRRKHQPLDSDVLLDEDASLAFSPAELLDLNDALDLLSEEHPDTAQMLNLRFFAGLSTDEIADFFGMSPRNANRTMAYGKAWLRRHLDTSRHG